MNESIRSQDDALYQKIAWRVVPVLFACYVVNYIDRVNISFAKLQFLQDLHLSDAVFGVAAGIFFIGYAVFEVPSNLMLARIGARLTLLRIMVLWGIVTVLLMFTKNATTLYVLRFLLGAAEAGFFPGLILYLTYWFPDSRRGRINSRLLIAVPLAGIIGGPLSGWIMTAFHEAMNLRGWQWLFLLEGIPAILLGIAAYVFLDDGPKRARWLSDAEKARIAEALAEDRGRRGERVHDRPRFRDLLTDRQVLLYAAVYFTMYMGMGAVGFWLPTILRQAGVQSVLAIGLLAGLIAVCTMVGNLALGHSSDRRMERRWHVAGCGIVAAVCLLLLSLTRHNVPATVLLLAIAQITMFSLPIIFWTIPAARLDSRQAAGGLALISSVGAVGGFLSPTLVGFLKTQTGSLYAGLAVVAVIVVAGMLALLRFVPPDAPWGQAQLATEN